MASNSFTELSDKLDALTLLVAEMNRKVQGTSKPSDTPLSVEEAAAYLNLSKSRVYRLTSQRGIPFIKRGQGILFLKAELDNWLQSKQQKTVEEVQQDT